MNTRKTSLIFLFLLCAALSGCVLSLQPLFTGKDQIYDSALEGDWQIKGDKGTFSFRRFPTERFYVLETALRDQPKGEFNAVLGTIGTNRFLQISPKRPDNIHAKSLYGGHFIQAYSFWMVRGEKDALALTPLNYEWLERMDKEKRLNIKHEQQPHGFIVLTASTEDLKAFVLKYADDKLAFSDGLSFEKKR